MKRVMKLGVFLLVFPFSTTTVADDGSNPDPQNILIAKASGTGIEYRVVSETIRIVTAYNVGDPSQNFGDPCIAANGENICRALNSGAKRCAANFVPFGTELYIQNYGTFVVTDRTHSRYRNRVDIAMKRNEVAKAKRFGRKRLRVQILEKVQPVMAQ